jgi:hypothetical protein
VVSALFVLSVSNWEIEIHDGVLRWIVKVDGEVCSHTAARVAWSPGARSSTGSPLSSDEIFRLAA